MASIEARQLFDSLGGPPIRGGVFTLAEPSPISVKLKLSTGWEIEVTQDSNLVIARGKRRVGHDVTRLEAIDNVQRGLDLFSFQESTDLSLIHAYDEHIVWWRKKDGITLRSTTSQTLGKADMSANLTVVPKSGKSQRPSMAPDPIWHESARYFRQAQLTDDILDAYRNIYLAVESILNHVAPIHAKPNGRPAEQEGAWLRRALRASEPYTSRHAPSGASSPEDRMLNLVYRFRNAIFHAKNTAFVVMPGNADYRSEIDSARRVLLSFYQDLAAKEFNLRRLSGGFTTYGWNQTIGGVLEGAPNTIKVCITDATDTPIALGVPFPASIGAVTVEGRNQKTPELPLTRTYLAQCETTTLYQLGPIARFALIDNVGNVAKVFDLLGVLDLTGSTQFEIQLGLRIASRRAPKHLFSS